MVQSLIILIIHFHYAGFIIYEMLNEAVVILAQLDRKKKKKEIKKTQRGLRREEREKTKIFECGGEAYQASTWYVSERL